MSMGYRERVILRNQLHSVRRLATHERLHTDRSRPLWPRWRQWLAQWMRRLSA